ncbi:MAG: hypothetical protein ACFFCI_21430 [Promethearchaeota archaeon]
MKPSKNEDLSQNDINNDEDHSQNDIDNDEDHRKRNKCLFICIIIIIIMMLPSTLAFLAIF